MIWLFSNKVKLASAQGQFVHVFVERETKESTRFHKKCKRDACKLYNLSRYKFLMKYDTRKRHPQLSEAGLHS
jgi:hypothetical protein